MKQPPTDGTCTQPLPGPHPLYGCVLPDGHPGSHRLAPAQDPQAQAMLGAYIDNLNKGEQEFYDAWELAEPGGPAKWMLEAYGTRLNELQTTVSYTLAEMEGSHIVATVRGHSGPVVVMVAYNGDEEAGPATLVGFFDEKGKLQDMVGYFDMSVFMVLSQEVNQ